MADVAMTFSVLPEDPSMDLEEMKRNLKDGLEKKCKIAEMSIQEIAFGLKKIKLVVIVKDEDGQQDMIEEVASGVKGVGQVDFEDSSLV
ncbi:MAG: elongation factor 1-beta [Candidatus Thermoplasmatota archaeon]|nr:elongation factor 1-beta [Candidatus Thermoplasmatota archaeon]MCL5790650.1 elongation factor 1-beta [Candidatus Thermoplasmatota archaeon]